MAHFTRAPNTGSWAPSNGDDVHLRRSCSHYMMSLPDSCHATLSHPSWARPGFWPPDASAALWRPGGSTKLFNMDLFLNLWSPTAPLAFHVPRLLNFPQCVEPLIPLLFALDYSFIASNNRCWPTVTWKWCFKSIYPVRLLLNSKWTNWQPN